MKSLRGGCSAAASPTLRVGAQPNGTLYKCLQIAYNQQVQKKLATFLVANFHWLVWWRFTDSNRGPVDYDSIALTD
jgi:hypothetical protein